MNRRIHSSAGFSLVEVTLALGVAAFCLIALFGLLPLGVQANQNAISQTAAASVLSSVVADLRAAPKTSLTSSLYGVTFGTTKLLYFDGEGRSVSSTDPSVNPRYRVTITFPASPISAFAPTFATLKVTWPALVDPATNTPAGFVETFAAFDRH
ncbi:MAG: hypothetical protein QOC70_2835 [Verrucomicrobiota bacterium]|jgi:uncharacterized protein (TIGR02598 family)